MSIPPFDVGGVLPSFSGADATNPADRSPYRVTIDDIVGRFATCDNRAKLLLGLNNYRAHLLSGGFVHGHQWIDGSFVEDVERLRGRPPKDIDLVTVFHRPSQYVGNDVQWQLDYRSRLHRNFFEAKLMKQQFSCDTYCIDMDHSPNSLIRSSSYWLGLFSEQRSTSRRKGIVEVPLMTDPAEAVRIESQIRANFNV